MNDASETGFSLTLVGSLDALGDLLATQSPGALGAVVVIATAAAFAGTTAAANAVVATLGDRASESSVLELANRTATTAPDVEAVLVGADTVVLCDGAVLHARSVWRQSVVQTVLASKSILAIGAVGSVLGQVMIDPRGGAPTTGMGFFADVAITTSTSEDEVERSRSLVGSSVRLLRLGGDAIVHYEQGRWRTERD